MRWRDKGEFGFSVHTQVCLYSTLFRSNPLRVKVAQSGGGQDKEAVQETLVSLMLLLAAPATDLVIVQGFCLPSGEQQEMD